MLVFGGILGDGAGEVRRIDDPVRHEHLHAQPGMREVVALQLRCVGMAVGTREELREAMRVAGLDPRQQRVHAGRRRVGRMRRGSQCQDQRGEHPADAASESGRAACADRVRRRR